MGFFSLFSADGLERAVKGYKPSSSEHKLGAQVFHKASAPVKKLPAKVDLRYLMTPVEDDEEDEEYDEDEEKYDDEEE